MKIITIGRGENSHIFIDNPLVSRQHAILKIHGNGKMFIVDKSTNGTSINGAPIKREREYPVSRRDVVTFAGASQLDWKEVPDALKVYKIIGLALVAIAMIIGIVFAIKAIVSSRKLDNPPTPSPDLPAQVDPGEASPTIPNEPKTSIDEEELEKIIKELGGGNSTKNPNKGKSSQGGSQTQKEEESSVDNPSGNTDTSTEVTENGSNNNERTEEAEDDPFILMK